MEGSLLRQKCVLRYGRGSRHNQATKVESVLILPYKRAKTADETLMRRTGSCFRVVRSSTRRVVCPRAEQSFQSSPKPPKVDFKHLQIGA